MSATEQRPLTSYAALVAAFWTLVGGFVAVNRGRLPERVGFADLLRIGLATHKVSRLVAKDDVTTFMRAPVTRDPDAQKPEREGLQRALGELITCPYCLDIWIAAGFSCAFALRPRETRFATTIFSGSAVAGFLHAGYVRLKGDS